MQVLFSLLLTVPFSARFSQVTRFERRVYFAALLLTAAANVALIAPVAYHRLLFAKGEKARVVALGNRLALAGLVLLLLAFTAVLLLVTDVLFHTVAATAVATGFGAADRQPVVRAAAAAAVAGRSLRPGGRAPSRSRPAPAIPSRSAAAPIGRASPNPCAWVQPSARSAASSATSSTPSATTSTAAARRARRPRRSWRPRAGPAARTRRRRTGRP